MTNYAFNINAAVWEQLAESPVPSQSIIKDSETLDREASAAQAEVKTEDFSIQSETDKVNAILADVAALEMLQFSLRPDKVNSGVTESMIANIASRNGIDIGTRGMVAMESLYDVVGVSLPNPVAAHNQLNSDINYVTESLLDAIKDISSKINKKIADLRKWFKETFSNNITNMKACINAMDSGKINFKEGSVTFDYSSRLTRNNRPATKEIMTEVFKTMDEMTHGFDYGKLTKAAVDGLNGQPPNLDTFAQQISFPLPKVFKETPNSTKNKTGVDYRWEVSDGSSMSLPGVPGLQLYSPFAVNYDSNGKGFHSETKSNSDDAQFPIISTKELSGLMRETVSRYEDYWKAFEKIFSEAENCKAEVYNTLQKFLKDTQSKSNAPIKEGLWDEIKKGASTWKFQAFDAQDRQKVADDQQFVVTGLNVVKFVHFCLAVFGMSFIAFAGGFAGSLIGLIITVFLFWLQMRIWTWFQNIGYRVVFFFLLLIIGKDDKDVKPWYDEYVQAFSKLTSDQKKHFPDPNDIETAKAVVGKTDMNQFFQRFVEDIGAKLYSTLSDNTINMTIGFTNLLNAQASALVAYYDACNKASN